jgi:proline iminopeptidase
MDNYIDDVEAIRRHLSLNNMIVIGKSYGSMCALGYALRYPHAVSKLVLAAGAPSYHFLETAKKNLQRSGSAKQIKACEKLWTGSFKSKNEVHDYFSIMSTLYSVKARTKPDSVDLAAKSEMFSYEALNEGFRHSFWQFDYENELQHVLCPTLILVGREDWVNDAKYGEQMAMRIPHSQLHVFEKSGHAMESDVTEEYFQIIADFIQR